MTDKTDLDTEDLRALFDIAVGSLNFTSGFLDTEEVEVLRRVAAVIGVDPMAATPKEFVTQYPHDFTPHRYLDQPGYEEGSARRRLVIHDCNWCGQPERRHPDDLMKRR